jgi:hypothetical protein
LVRVRDPAIPSVTLTKRTPKGDPSDIFHRRIGEPDEYWITPGPSRIFSPYRGRMELFTLKGTWLLLITEEQHTHMVLIQNEIDMK